MVPFIVTAREQHAVKTPQEYLGKHAAAIARLQKAGMRYAVHHSPGIPLARIFAGQWVIDCECRAGNATDPRWGFACCFGCGAIHRQIIFPADWEAIERALIERTQPAHRHWLPGEPIENLMKENADVLAAGAAL